MHHRPVGFRMHLPDPGTIPGKQTEEDLLYFRSAGRIAAQAERLCPADRIAKRRDAEGEMQWSRAPMINADWTGSSCWCCRATRTTWASFNSRSTWLVLPTRLPGSPTPAAQSPIWHA